MVILVRYANYNNKNDLAIGGARSLKKKKVCCFCCTMNISYIVPKNVMRCVLECEGIKRLVFNIILRCWCFIDDDFFFVLLLNVGVF